MHTIYKHSIKNCLQIYVSSSHHLGKGRSNTFNKTAGTGGTRAPLYFLTPSPALILLPSPKAQTISTFFTHLPPLILNILNPQAQVTQGSAKFFCKGQIVNILDFTGHKAKSRVSVGT